MEPKGENKPITQYTNNPINQSENPTLNNLTAEQSNNFPKDNHWITIAAMAIFVVLSLGVVVFLYYQNQQLKSVLAGYQAAQTAPPPTPTATVDPTADWKTYTSTDFGFTFRYPPTYTINDQSAQSVAVNLYPAGYDALSLTQKQSAPSISFRETVLASTPQIWISMLKSPGYSNVRDTSNKVIDQVSAIQYTFNNTQAGDGQDETETAVPFKNNELLLINLNSVTNDSKSIYTQILSTFKFLGQGDKGISRFGISLNIPSGWSVIDNASDKDIPVLSTSDYKGLPPKNEVITDNNGCVFSISSTDIGRGGPTNNLINNDITVDQKTFTKRSWFNNNEQISFFNYIFSNSYPNTIYTWNIPNPTLDCDKKLDNILYSIKFTQ